MVLIFVRWSGNMLSGNVSIGCLLPVSIRKKFLGPQVLFLLFAAAAQATGPTIYGTPQTAANTTSGSTSLTINLPNGGTPVSASTIYIIQVADRASSPIFNVPSGFTQLCSISVGSLNEEQTFYEVFGANSPPPATVTLTQPGGWTWAGATAVSYQNINPSAPFDAGCQTVSQTTSSTTLAGPSITTTKPNETVIWNFFVHGDVGTGAVTVSQGTTEAQVTRAALAGDGYLNYTDKPEPSAGASGTNTLTWGRAASVSGAIAFALEAPGGYSPPPQDQYGGLLALPCTNTNTTFSVVTAGNRKVLCTPGQHEFNGRGPFNFDWGSKTKDESGQGFNGYETTKYGTASVYGTQETANMKTWGWNMLGPFATSAFQGYLFDIPYIAFGSIAYYARTNFGGYTTNCAVKELMYLLGQSGNVTRWGGYSNANG